ncbi:MAG: hypothetical protein ABSD02_09655 [Steroidobacteraceae bacterium]|jgi:hypothetical protein
MKRSEFLLIGLLAISGASAGSLDVPPPPRAPHVASIANKSAQASSAGLRARWQRGRQATRAQLTDLKNDVVQDVRATTTFMQEQANNPSSRSRWLTALAGCGLVMLQLRRKHKSMPQRRIARYG